MAAHGGGIREAASQRNRLERDPLRVHPRGTPLENSWNAWARVIPEDVHEHEVLHVRGCLMDWAWASGIGVVVLGALTVVSWFAVQLLGEVDAETTDLADS